MATSLATKSVGPPDNSFTWYLQTGGVALATGFQVALGDGSETFLWLDNAGIGVRSAGGFVAKVQSSATKTRTLNFGDGDGKLRPEMVATLSADLANSTTTAAAVTDLALSLEANAVYEFELLLIVKSAATSTSPRWTLNGPTAQTSYVSYEILGLGASNAQYTAWGTAVANAVNAPGVDTPYRIRVTGVCKTTGTLPASTVNLNFFSEVGASAVTLLAGSEMRFRKLN